MRRRGTGSPGNITLLDPAKKGRYTQSDFVEAYSKIAIGNFLLNQQNLPITPAGHRLVQNIARAVDTTRMFQTIGNAWLAYANSPEGKAHLEESGHSIADIMREAGFTFSNQIAQARATADQRTEVLQASNWQPAIEDELDALLEDIEAEEQLSELNQQEANQPTTIPAEESITGQEIVIDPVEAALQKIEKKRLQEYYKDSISRQKKYLQEAERDLKNAKEAQARIKKALEKNGFRSEEEKDFVLYTLEHKQDLEADNLEAIAHYKAVIKQEEAELERLKRKSP